MSEKRKTAPGEDGLIELARSVFGDAPGHIVVPSGDDTAVLRTKMKGAETLVTTDLLVEGTHFRLEWSSPWQVAWKAMAASVSDIAAMGGRPTAAVVSVGIRAANRETFFKQMAEGLAAASKRWDVPVVGGDVVKSDKTVINVTMLGEAAPGKSVLRKGARPGDVILVTGACGDSAAGFEILSAKGKKDLTKTEKALADRHLAPEPSVEAGQAAAGGGASAMMDLSDGIATDLPRLCARSGVGALIGVEDLPVSPDLARWCKKNDKNPADYAFAGGEDFNLLITAPPDAVEVLQTLLDAAGSPATPVGEIKPRDHGMKILTPDNKTAPWPDKGFRHF